MLSDDGPRSRASARPLRGRAVSGYAIIGPTIPATPSGKEMCAMIISLYNSIESNYGFARKNSPDLLIQLLHLLNLLRRMRFQIIPMLLERLDGRQQVIGQRVHKFDPQLHIALALVDQTDSAVRGVLALRIVAEPARAQPPQDADVVADVHILVLPALQAHLRQFWLCDAALVMQDLHRRIIDDRLARVALVIGQQFLDRLVRHSFAWHQHPNANLPPLCK